MSHWTRSTPWMRGITPARLGILAAACIVMHINNPSFLNDYVVLRLGRILYNAAIFFVAALPMFVLVVKTEIRTSHSALGKRISALTFAVVAGAASFTILRWALRLGTPPLIGTPDAYWEYSLGHFFRALTIGALFTSILFYEAREREAQRRMHAARLSRIEIDKQMAEARLQLLQAQIEPHFLFNSLASVKRLYENHPARGRSLLQNLGDYLRVAISHARLHEVSVAEEIALARAFLHIFRVRMGDRLSVRIDVPPELERERIPPLMVGTLVENAIKHGIGPRASGGTVSITARSGDGFLELEVCDDGVGFRDRSGHGVGLANIRARLDTLFAAEGALELAANATGGVTATLRVPRAPAPA